MRKTVSVFLISRVVYVIFTLFEKKNNPDCALEISHEKEKNQPQNCPREN